MTSDEVAALLKRCGLRQKAFAALLGVDVTTVSRWFASPDRRHDAIPIPQSAVAFALAWESLSLRKRKAVISSLGIQA